jgi:hypothetical protein
MWKITNFLYFEIPVDKYPATGLNNPYDLSICLNHGHAAPAYTGLFN